MSEYNILVVDDQPAPTKRLFSKLFDRDDRFSYHQIQTYSEFISTRLSDYDAILLDINLDRWANDRGEELTLTEALTVIGRSCPVALISRAWEQGRTHEQMSEALSQHNEVTFIATFVLNNLDGQHAQDYAESMRGQLYLAINSARHRGLLELEPDAPIRILHLSDPQYGDPHSDDWSSYVEEQIAAYIKNDLRQEIHFVAISGDISFSGAVDEYKEAEVRLPKLLNAILPLRENWKERVLLVPGNHDVNLRLSLADRYKVKIKKNKLVVTELGRPPESYPHLPYALSPFRDFAWRLTGDPRWKETDNLNWLNDSFVHLGIRFLLLNSVSGLCCDAPQRAEFARDELQELVTLRKDGLFGISISHHGPPEVADKGDDVLQQWPVMAGFCSTRGVQLYIHGHGHHRKIDRFHLSNQSASTTGGKLDRNEIIRVMAPTTHLDNGLRPLEERRGFNIITLERSYGEVGSVKVDTYEFRDEIRPSKAHGSGTTFVL